MENLLKLLTENKMLDSPVTKFTLIIDEGGTEHGALFFLTVGKRNYKVMIPHPHHISLLENGIPSSKKVVIHKEAMLLK